MAQAHHIPQASGIDHFTWWIGCYLDDELLRHVRSDSSVGPERGPVCLMDLIYLWLQDTDPEHESICSQACPTYESYLLSVIFIIDAWTDENGTLTADRWEHVLEKHGGVTTVFPRLSEHESRNPYYEGRDDGVFGGQHDHPALRKDVFEYYAAEAHVRAVDHHARVAVRYAVKKIDEATTAMTDMRKRQ